MYGLPTDSNSRRGAPAQAAVKHGDSGQLVRLRIVAVNRPQLTRGAGVPRSFPVERSHRAPAARLPALSQVLPQYLCRGAINPPYIPREEREPIRGALMKKF